jgi:glycosyltransferase involved in cell wall biosynthesis
MRLAGETVRQDHRYGYCVFRTREPWRVVEDVPRPDVVVLQDGRFLRMADALARARLPVAGYFHGLEFEDWDVPGRAFRKEDLPEATYIVNSRFTAERFSARHGSQPKVVNPVFRPERYRTTWKPSNVTFINPVAEKGVDLALAIARRCPEIPFVFVKGWPLKPLQQLRLKHALSTLSNVTMLERTGDMRQIYQNCKILLVPSVWPRETWGRVASEAQINGIPVLGSDIGGLPEAIGDGGIVLRSTDPVDLWVEVLKRLWHDEAWFQMKSQQALAHAERPSMKIDYQVNGFIETLRRAAGQWESRREAAPAA